ncbi:MAG: DUF1549 domain-containing protein [Acidobacteriota bacterium]|nr:DUF1549 domain-containing protein [Acidobacteriota bacterium]
MSNTEFAGLATWLDVLRYADLDGLDGSVMPAASGIYLWRDWLISALNHDMPYDQFVRAQILGSRYKEHTTVSAGGCRASLEGSPEDQFALGFLARAALLRHFELAAVAQVFRDAGGAEAVAPDFSLDAGVDRAAADHGGR